MALVTARTKKKKNKINKKSGNIELYNFCIIFDSTRRYPFVRIVMERIDRTNNACTRVRARPLSKIEIHAKIGKFSVKIKYIHAHIYIYRYKITIKKREKETPRCEFFSFLSLFLMDE